MLHETCTCLSLPLMDRKLMDRDEVTLHELLDRYTGAEEIEGFQCKKCSLQATLRDLELSLVALDRRMEITMDESRLDRLRLKRDGLVAKRIRLERAHSHVDMVSMIIWNFYPHIGRLACSSSPSCPREPSRGWLSRKLLRS